MRVHRRTFSRAVGLGLVGAALPLQAQRGSNLRIGYTGITWPWGNAVGGSGGTRLADPTAIEQIVKDIAGLGI